MLLNLLLMMHLSWAETGGGGSPCPAELAEREMKAGTERSEETATLCVTLGLFSRQVALVREDQ